MNKNNMNQSIDEIIDMLTASLRENASCDCPKCRSRRGEPIINTELSGSWLDQLTELNREIVKQVTPMTFLTASFIGEDSEALLNKIVKNSILEEMPTQLTKLFGAYVSKEELSYIINFAVINQSRVIEDAIKEILKPVRPTAPKPSPQKTTEKKPSPAKLKPEPEENAALKTDPVQRDKDMKIEKIASLLKNKISNRIVYIEDEILPSTAFIIEAVLLESARDFISSKIESYRHMSVPTVKFMNSQSVNVDEEYEIYNGNIPNVIRFPIDMDLALILNEEFGLFDTSNKFSVSLGTTEADKRPASECLEDGVISLQLSPKGLKENTRAFDCSVVLDAHKLIDQLVASSFRERVFYIA